MAARGDNVTITVTMQLNWGYFSLQFKGFENNMELGLGWLRAVAQGYIAVTINIS